MHRVIKALLGAKRYQLSLADTVPAAAPLRKVTKVAAKSTKAPKASSHELALWEQAGAHCSANERRADEASRDVEAWLKCRYMRDRLGEEFSGTVSAVAAFGVFVTLDELYVDGLVHISELGGDYYRFDEVRQELRGERSGVRYGIGTRVRVQVSRVDLDGRKIDFRMVREADEERLLAAGRPDKGRSKTSAVETLKDLSAADRASKDARKKTSRAAKGGETSATKKARKGKSASSGARKAGPRSSR